jgi:hypothetical protein
MGEIADTLRATLRQLAQSDARLYRGLADEVGEGWGSTTEADLLALNNEVLRKLCAQRGIKVAARTKKSVMVGLLLADPKGRDVAAMETTPGAAQLQALDQRLDRLEQLLLLVAQHVGVPEESLARGRASTAETRRSHEKGTPRHRFEGD